MHDASLGDACKKLNHIGIYGHQFAIFDIWEEPCIGGDTKRL